MAIYYFCRGNFKQMYDIISKYCAVKENESLKNHTTFNIGGIAKLAAFPHSAEALAGVIKMIKGHGINYILLGAGSNVLICENYFDGIAVITSQMAAARTVGDYIYADCGVSLNKLAALAKENSLSGLEFAYGIPGTLGGAVYMNAGAYGGQTGDIVDSSEYIDAGTLEIKALGAERHGFGYRTSVYGKNKDFIMLSAVLKLKRGDKSEIESAMNKNMAARRQKQPLEYPSAGSAFKRGDNFFAAQLIDGCGLKGFTVGGAQVSEKHAGFIINKGNATFSDVVNLTEHIKSAVYDKTGITIEREIKIIEF